MTIDRTIGNYHDSSNARIRKIGSFTAGVYATNGEVMTPDTLGVGRVEALLIEPFTNGTDIRLARYDYVNFKVKLFDQAFNEVANGVDLSAYTARFELIGVA